jgi:radical SAM protein with 4Fe4S-binding SPASM domain
MSAPISEPTIHQPVVSGIETTNHCHLHCRICPHDGMTRPKGFIEKDLFALTARQVAEFSPRRMVSLHHFGDPLLHPALPELIQLADRAGLRTKLSTVGSHLTPALAAALADSPLSILKFSFWGLDREQFESCQRASFERTMANISAFLDRERHCRVVIEIMAPGGEDVARFPHYREWREFLKRKTVRNWTGDAETVNAFTGLPCRPSAEPCEKMWWSDLKILWNGDVTPCCRDYDGKGVVGNIRRESIADIWAGPAMERLRAAHRDGRRAVIPLCRRCGAVAARHTPAHSRAPFGERGKTRRIHPPGEDDEA